MGMSAQAAQRWGLVNRVVPHEPDAGNLETAEKICANSAVAVSASKDVVYQGLDLPLDFPGAARHVLRPEWRIEHTTSVPRETP